MEFAEALTRLGDTYVAEFRRADGWAYRTEPCATVEEAKSQARRWLYWYSNVLTGSVESIYYIVAVPLAWAGPPDSDHLYSGLQVKIGRTKNVLRRLSNLRTGTSSDLIIHALEPGSKDREAVLHRQFSSDRRSGEWFSCSPSLTQHIFGTWYKNNALPREHQVEVMLLQERIDALTQARRLLGTTPDLVNPSLEESWAGKSVLLDFAYSGWRVSIGKPIRRGAVELDMRELIGRLGPPRPR